MSEIYKEYMVKREKSVPVTVLKFVCIAMAVPGFVLGSVIGLILAVILSIVAYILHLQADIEFEYLYLDKELSVDKIMAKSKRKHVDTYLMDQMEIVAPIGSHHLDAFKAKDAEYKTFDYTSKSKHAGGITYVIYSNTRKKILIEVDGNFIKAMHMSAPRIVHTN